MYKMVFLDIDGTILSSDEQLDSEFIHTIEKVKERGVLVGLATGRSLDGAKPYGERFGCRMYVVYNGGWAIDNETTVFDQRIPRHVAHHACMKTDEWGGAYIHFFGEGSLSNRPPSHIEHLLPRASLCDLSETKQDAHRLTLYLDREHRDRLKDEIVEASCFDEGDRLEIFHKGSKWSGILSFMQKYDIASEDVVTIGNGLNDIGMLRGAGLGIAMGNAPDEVKKIANRITKSNDQHGVTYALKEIFNL